MGKTWKMHNTLTGATRWASEAQRSQLSMEWVTAHEGLYSVVAEAAPGPDEVLLENASLEQERELCRAVNEGLDAYIMGPY